MNLLILALSKKLPSPAARPKGQSTHYENTHLSTKLGFYTKSSFRELFGLKINILCHKKDALALCRASFSIFTTL